MELCVRAAAYTHKGEVKSEPSNSETGIPFDHRFAALADALQTTTRRYFHSPALKAPEHRNKRQNRGFLPLGKGVVTHSQKSVFFLIKTSGIAVFQKKWRLESQNWTCARISKAVGCSPAGAPHGVKSFHCVCYFHIYSREVVLKNGSQIAVRRRIFAFSLFNANESSQRRPNGLCAKINRRGFQGYFYLDPASRQLFRTGFSKGRFSYF